MSRLDYASPDRINPYRLYFPGLTYSPEDLVDHAAQEDQADPMSKVKYPTNKQAFWFGDFKNVEFLRMFLNEAGRIQPRRVTNLRGPAQRRVARSINTARQLALLNPCSRYPIVDLIEHTEEDAGWSSDEDYDDDEEDDDEKLSPERMAMERYSRTGRVGYSALPVDDDVLGAEEEALDGADDLPPIEELDFEDAPTTDSDDAPPSKEA